MKPSSEDCAIKALDFLLGILHVPLRLLCFTFMRIIFNIFRDFDAMLYLCEMSFRMLPLDTYWRLIQGVVFPCYVLAVIVGLVFLGIALLQEWR